VFDGHYPILTVPRHIGMASIRFYTLLRSVWVELH